MDYIAELGGLKMVAEAQASDVGHTLVLAHLSVLSRRWASDTITCNGIQTVIYIASGKDNGHISQIHCYGAGFVAKTN